MRRYICIDELKDFCTEYCKAMFVSVRAYHVLYSKGMSKKSYLSLYILFNFNRHGQHAYQVMLIFLGRLLTSFLSGSTSVRPNSRICHLSTDSLSTLTKHTLALSSITTVMVTTCSLIRGCKTVKFASSDLNISENIT